MLLETMPVDAERQLEASIAFAFLALGLGDPELAGCSACTSPAWVAGLGAHLGDLAR